MSERLPIFESVVADFRDGRLGGGTAAHAWRTTPRVPSPRPRREAIVGDHFDEDGNGLADRAADRTVEHTVDQPAMTAGQEDHTDPWAFAGEDVYAPLPGEVPDGVA